MNKKLELIKEMYDIRDNEIKERREALDKLKPYIDEIMDSFYKKLLEKDEFSRFFLYANLDELKQKQIKFIEYILSKEFDDKLYTKISKVAISHYHIKLDPILMSYGYHILSEIILLQSKKDANLLPHLKLIIKYLKISESIMSQEYFVQKNLENSPYRANNLFIAVNKLHMSYLKCRYHIKHSNIEDVFRDEFNNSIDELKEYKDILSEAGFDLSSIKRYCTEFYNTKDESILDRLHNAIYKPINSISLSSYLSIISSLALLNSMTDIIYKKDITKEKEFKTKDIQNKIERLILKNFGWAIDSLQFQAQCEDEKFDIIKMIEYKKDIFYLCIDIKDIPNSLYIIEAIDLLSENIKLSLYLYTKELELNLK